ncbi:MAG: DUF3299 domain-containing protein [Flavobacteriales bacterium]|jgi:hypothetical protein|nr:DUF3299 domain-containing protein [Flavobacteriales bacterium]MDG1439130.1 DUF3299 domain-containing protein [Flavobacteriales bacterium]MDG1798246.1 DUF3299 domain-containing protein [Flavobacteriales bacterium]|tara:strand:- start:454 stop:891 length:438 start_codon:yes stop_codon:yes gene_type:complete
MKNKIILITISFLFSFPIFSQNIISWELLKNVEFDEIWSEEFQAYYMVPKFSSSVKVLDNKEVQIRGFIIPVDIVQDYYVLSANPYSSCFFCGQAGPESVMEVQLIKKYEGLRMDQVITFKGKLKLNVDDIYQLNYILEDAEIVE